MADEPTNAARGPTRLLLVDDNASNRLTLAALLEDEGCVVFEADCGTGGLDLLDEAQPHVIVCDLHMPDMTGLDVVQRVREIDDTVPVIILSGDGELSAVLNAVRQGAFDYVVKAGDIIDKLSVAIDRAARDHWMRRDNQRLTRDVSDANARLEAQLEELSQSYERLAAVSQAERVARQRSEDLERAQMEQSRFLAVMSHELRTPMHGVLGCAQVLREQSLDEDQRGLVDTILASGESLLELLNRLLELSRADSGAMEIASEPFDLGALALELFQSNQPVARDKGIDLRLDIADSCNDVVLGDRFRIRQVLQNLLSNAIKFTDDGFVALNARRDGASDRVVWSVRDTGIGIAKDAQDRVWSAFTQADVSTTRQYGGTGLGLTITRELIGLMHGEVALQSAPGEGTVFRVSLPLPRVEQGRRSASTRKAPTIPTLARSLHVLVAEDNPVNQLVIQRVLELLKCTYDIVDNGLLAVQRLGEASYDAVLMDLEMPVLDGLQATGSIRGTLDPDHRLPIIALTASGSNEVKRACKQAGMSGFLTKPLQIAALAEMLGSLTEGSEWADNADRVRSIGRTDPDFVAG